MNDSGVDLKSLPVIPTTTSSTGDGGLKKNIPTASSSSSLSNASSRWDEDWVTTTRGSSMEPKPLSQPPKHDVQFPMIMSTQQQKQTQTQTSCPPAVEFEWPHQEKSNTSSSASFDDLDPFANWLTQPTTNHSLPPPATNGVGGLFLTGTENQVNNNYNTNWGNNMDSSPPNGGFPRYNQQGDTSSSSTSGPKASDLGSIFASSKTPQALRLAPPPLNAVGRGRGGGAQGQTRPSRAKPSSEQPPLLDLL